MYFYYLTSALFITNTRTPEPVLHSTLFIFVDCKTNCTVTMGRRVSVVRVILSPTHGYRELCVQ